jgi:hypothetical protein
MGYKCAQCGVDFGNKKQIVEHMIDVHGSPFIEGDEGMVKYSLAYANKKNHQTAMKAIADSVMEV